MNETDIYRKRQMGGQTGKPPLSQLGCPQASCFMGCDTHIQARWFKLGCCSSSLPDS